MLKDFTPVFIHCMQTTGSKGSIGDPIYMYMLHSKVHMKAFSSKIYNYADVVYVIISSCLSERIIKDL